MNKVYTALDIAKWFINYNDRLRNIDNEDTDNISNLKLQKLLYYAQGVYVALKGVPLFNDDIVAWTHGPVVESVYQEYKQYGSSGITEKYDDVCIDSETEKILIEVYNVFGQYSAWGLRNMTHEETPWKETRKNGVIYIDKIKDYFKEHYVD